MPRVMSGLAVLLSVTSSLLVGLVLAVAPWTPLWDANQFLQPYPALKLVALSPFTRGAVTGLGLVNLLLAVAELRDVWRALDDVR